MITITIDGKEYKVEEYINPFIKFLLRVMLCLIWAFNILLVILSVFGFTFELIFRLIIFIPLFIMTGINSMSVMRDGENFTTTDIATWLEIPYGDMDDLEYLLYQARAEVQAKKEEKTK